MGENLVLNMASKGYQVAVYNRTTSKVDNFISGRAEGKTIVGAHSLEELCSKLKRPRRVMIMVKAGAAVDKVIEGLLPFLEEGDIVIDGGNSEFPDSSRRTTDLAEKGILYIGTGVSGGEEGALKGPSIMPGGNPAAWEHVKPIFQSISAQTDKGEPCYLIEITRDILGYKDEDGVSTVDVILDKAGQKGTGKWTAISALDVGQPLTLIGEAVFARCLSALKDERVEAAKVLNGPDTKFEGDKQQMIDDLEQALYASKIVSYAQGYQLMRAISDEKDWELNYGAIALMWRGGCIIRSAFLNNIRDAFEKDPGLTNLLLDQFFEKAVENAQDSWRRVVASAVTLGIPMPAIGAALAYFDGYRTARLPANLLQAQRDYFGAHTYERTDKERGEFFHTNWTGRGGTTSSTTYNA
ncbi:UNVERIFIED_CONTAM: hypothetical protein GTU68_021486 [Idotea baltica]|nr:hypothetical protein [Idotea baltica]